MTYPFPGMNPYLEHRDVWHDFHNGLTVRIRDQLVPQIRPKYLTKVDENVYIHELSAEERFFMGRPDVAVARGSSTNKRQRRVSEACQPLAEGLLIPAVDQIKEPFVEIRDSETNAVLVREFLRQVSRPLGAVKPPGPIADRPEVHEALRAWSELLLKNLDEPVFDIH